MENFRIDELGRMNEVGLASLRGRLRKCLFFKEEACTAPRIRFEMCRNCCRIDPRAASKSLFDKIKELANKCFNFQETELG